MPYKREPYKNKLKYILANEAEALINSNYDDDESLINISQDSPNII